MVDFGLGHLALRKTFNRRLAVTVCLIAISQFNYGFDQQGFGATQSMDQFDKQFGVYDSKTGEYVLPTVWLSLFNGLMYIGYISGS